MPAGPYDLETEDDRADSYRDDVNPDLARETQTRTHDPFALRRGQVRRGRTPLLLGSRPIACRAAFPGQGPARAAHRPPLRESGIATASRGITTSAIGAGGHACTWPISANWVTTLGSMGASSTRS